MKFTNEQAVEALRAELTNKGRKTQHVFDRTITSLVETLTKNKRFTDEEMGLPEFVADAIEILNIAEGDARKKNSDHAKYVESHPDPDPDKKADPDPEVQTKNPVLEAYEERIAALEKRLKEADTKSVLAQKRKDIIAKLKEKGVKDEEWLNDFLSEVNISENLDVDAKAESWVKLYNKSRANGGDSVSPANPSGDNISGAFARSVKAAAELAKKERVSIEPQNQ